MELMIRLNLFNIILYVCVIKSESNIAALVEVIIG